MEELLHEIIELLRAGENVDTQRLAALVRAHNNGVQNVADHLAKKKLYPYYLNLKNNDPERWAALGIDAELEERLLTALRMKPRRTASGVATITVITRPHACSSACVYCPNDVRMPKSYLSHEPACQRAERNFFDPYLQVTSRMKALTEMGHATDKVELIVLGGTWSDYSDSYRLWFATELFRALNDWPNVHDTANAKRQAYEHAGLSNNADELARRCAEEQQAVYAGARTYNQAIQTLYENAPSWQAAAAWQTSTLEELEDAQHANETADHRVVGFVVETRPDLITPATLTELRRLGCTKVQIGVQSLDADILAANGRAANRAVVERAFDLLRLFGFKIHTHFMANLLGAMPASDKADYLRFVTESTLQPDEVKLYPCALVAGTGLVAHFEDGTWRPYTEDELIDVLVADTLATPSWMRISRMIRDISAEDILVGNKKTNLRQMVEDAIRTRGQAHDVREIRFREISTNPPALEDLRLDIVPYETPSTSERFLQWVAPDNRIAGFLRLSLPHASAHENYAGLPTAPDEAMIREVHVYGTVARMGEEGSSAQHHGLGRKLIETACEIARVEGYNSVNVISSVGTRAYYRSLGFNDRGLYQNKEL